MSADGFDATLDWMRFTMPVCEHFGAEVRRLDLSGKRLACWMHLLPDTVSNLMPFVDAGVSLRVGGCNPDSTDPDVVDYLTRRGVLPAEALYEDPFTGIAPEGPDALFPGEQVDKLIDALHIVRNHAVA